MRSLLFFAALLRSKAIGCINPSRAVMAGPVPVLHAFTLGQSKKVVVVRHMGGHDRDGVVKGNTPKTLRQSG